MRDSHHRNGKHDSHVPVKVAVIPCAGLGTRMLPLTRVVPKELLPLGPKPLIEHILAELGEARFDLAIIVVRSGKELIKQHLTQAYPFPERAHSPSPIPNGLRLEFVEQHEPRGLADALKMALPLLNGQPFLMILPDQLFVSTPGATTQLVKHYSGQDSLTCVVDIPKEEAEHFGGARGVVLEGDGPCYKLEGLLGETGVPGLSDGRHTVRAFGRSIFKPKFLESVEDLSDEPEFSLAFTKYISQGVHEVVRLDGRPVDVGTRLSYQHFWKQWDSIRSSIL